MILIAGEARRFDRFHVTCDEHGQLSHIGQTTVAYGEDCAERHRLVTGCTEPIYRVYRDASGRWRIVADGLGLRRSTRPLAIKAARVHAAKQLAAAS